MNGPGPASDNGWDEYRRLVMHEFGRMDQELRRLAGKIDKLETTVAGLKVDIRLRGGFWGAIAGMIPAVVALIYMLLKG